MTGDDTKESWGWGGQLSCSLVGRCLYLILNLMGSRGRACGMFVLKGSLWLFYVRTNIEEATAVVQVRDARGLRLLGRGEGHWS